MTAEAVLGELLAEKKASISRRPRVPVTLEQVIEAHLETLAPTVRPATLASYQDIFSRLAGRILGPMPFDRLTGLDIEALFRLLRDRGTAPRTLRKLHTLLSRLFRWEREEGLVASAPAMPARPKVPRSRQKSLTPEQARLLLAACRQDLLGGGLMVWFALETGFRPQEYLGLTWGDLVDGQARLDGERKTEGGRRAVPLSALLLGALRAAYPETPHDRPIFPSRSGGPLPLATAEKRFRRLLVRAGLARIRLYDLRHSCASLLLAGGENIKVVQERLGHSSIRTTGDTYAHVLPGMQGAATARMAEILG